MRQVLKRLRVLLFGEAPQRTDVAGELDCPPEARQGVDREICMQPNRPYLRSSSRQTPSNR